MKKTCGNVGTRSKADGSSKAAKMLEAFLASEGAEMRCYAYGLCRDTVEAQELVQEACYRALKTWDRYDDSRRLGGWVTVILRNVFLDSRRGFERRNGLSLDSAPEGEEEIFWHERIPDNSEGILERLEREESSEEIRKAVARLEPRYRKVLQLCDAWGMSYTDAARILRVPLGTVRSRLHKARMMLRRTVKQDRLD